MPCVGNKIPGMVAPNVHPAESSSSSSSSKGPVTSKDVPTKEGEGSADPHLIGSGDESERPDLEGTEEVQKKKGKEKENRSEKP